jgi:hypothetical protein
MRLNDFRNVYFEDNVKGRINMDYLLCEKLMLPNDIEKEYLGFTEFTGYSGKYAACIIARDIWFFRLPFNFEFSIA